MVKVNLGAVDDSGFEDLPANKYHVALTDGEVRETGETSKHPGNDFWNLEFTVQDGPHEGRKMWTNAMLPPYDVFTLKNLLRASGRVSEEDLDADEFEVELFPEDLENDDAVALIDNEDPIEVIAVYGRAKKKNPKTGERGMEIKSFKPYDEDDWVVADDDDDMLP